MGSIHTKSYRLDGLPFPAVHEPLDDCRDHSAADACRWLSEHRTMLREELLRSGAILLRNFSIAGAAQFEAAVRIFAPELVNYRGGDSPRTAVTQHVYTSTVYPPSLPISLHNEMSYTTHYPSLLFFYCDVPPATGGETPLADCRELYRQIDPGIVGRFAQKKIRYIQNLSDGLGGMGKSWQQTFETTDRGEVESLLRARGSVFEWKRDGGLRVAETVDPVVVHPVSGETVFFSQAHQWHVSALDATVRKTLLSRMSEDELYHHCTFGDGSRIPEEDLTAARRALEAITIQFPWRKNDLLLVDNRLVAHGRSAFRGERRILVAMGGK